MRGFSIITSKLKEMYQMITLGGDAELELVDSLDPFSEGINFRSAPTAYHISLSTSFFLSGRIEKYGFLYKQGLTTTNMSCVK
jgi:chromosome segregation ATPase